MADANYVFNFDFRELIEAHKNTGADITAMYRKQEVPKVFLRPNGNNDEMYYTFDIDDGRIKKIYINDRDMGKVNFGMNIYIMEKEKLIRIVDDAFVHGYSYFTRDLIATTSSATLISPDSSDLIFIVFLFSAMSMFLLNRLYGLSLCHVNLE